MSTERLTTGGVDIDRSKTVRFQWNAKRVSGFEGDTIVSALAGAGHQIVSRSMKYHRKRGVLTADYWDPNCFVQVGDEPNVRGAHRLASDGMEVSAQNVWPSLERDVKAANGLVGRFLTPGFYYKTFIKPQFLWPQYQKVLKKFAPGGTIDPTSEPLYFDKRYMHPDVVVAGAGPAGLAAATAAAEAGARVLLVEHEHSVGGHLRWGSEDDRATATALESVAIAAGVEIICNSTVTGRYDHNWVAINQRGVGMAVERLIKARAKTLVVAGGLIERPYVFSGNDTPGVMTAGAARRLINLWGVKPGTTAVAMVANDHGDAAVADLEAAGITIAKVLDGRQGQFVSAASGGGSLSKVTSGDGTSIEADLLITAVGWTAPTSLLNMAGDRPSYDAAAARFFSTSLPADVLVVGGIAGDGTIDQLVEHAGGIGSVAGARAVSARRQLQAATARAVPVSADEPTIPAMPTPLGRDPHPELYRSDTHGMVDYSEDVSSKDLIAACNEGYDSIELMKRFTTVTMGPSQGKLETVNAVAILAEARGETIEEVGTTVWRPPYAPISLGALGGRIFEPERVSPMHGWHMANGAQTILAGQWIRPEHYGDPDAEVRNVRTNVGLIDVTPLGKLDLRGPDVPQLLNLLYTNKWSKLAIGGVRYGVMCAEDAVVLDDGVTAHLGEDHYLMTTTSSGAAAIWEWAENWLQTERPDWRVHVTPVTTAFASINIAGPNSRELLSRLVDDVDLSPDSFKYMQVREGTIAGVADCVMWRIGFTGELSYEIHVPSGHGLHVWETLLAEGADLGVGVFGLEGQRIMRLEKGHFIVGQDTDGLTKAPTAGISSLIKLDKDDFVGKTELSALDAAALPVLVALQPVDGSVVPEEAAQLVIPDSNDIVGRITSSRFSPTLNRSICLGQVTPDLAAAGTIVTVQLFDGTRIPATVMEHHAHFDPEGERLRG